MALSLWNLGRHARADVGAAAHEGDGLVSHAPASWRAAWSLLLPVQVLVPPLRELEGYVFEQLLRQLWRNVLLEATFGDSLAGASAAKPLLPSKHRQATREEQAVQRWLQALQVCSWHFLIQDPGQRSPTSGEESCACRVRRKRCHASSTVLT